MADHTVTVLSTNETFTVGSNEIVLDAAIRQGMYIPYSCRNGICRTCLYEVKAGTDQLLDADLCMITEQELESTFALYEFMQK